MIELIPLLLSCASTVHPDTVKDVAWVESRMNPYAIGVVDGRGLMPKTKEEALIKLKILENEEKSYSVGLMQIHKSNFEKYKVTAEKLLDPCVNLNVFEKVMTDCYERGKTLTRALSCYYSGNFQTGTVKEKEFSETSYVQRIGYVDEPRYRIPSTKSDKEIKTTVTGSNETRPKTNEKIRTVYPGTVLKNTEFFTQERPTKILRGEK